MNDQDRAKYNRELEEFKHQDIEKKLEIIFSKLSEFRNDITELKVRIAINETNMKIWSGMIAVIVSGIIGTFFYLLRS